jgi:hypothetical protein
MSGKEGNHCGDVAMEAIGTSHNAPEITIPTRLAIGR